MNISEPSNVVDQFIEAYNAGDDEKVLAVCDSNVKVTHHNRDVFIEGKETFREVLKQASELIPDKHFSNRRAKHVDGSNIIVEHTWGGTAKADFPGFAQAGEAINLDLCTRYTIKNGLITEYHDYG